jgi:ElaB/YqjD/DUF883 family membrane-anchored ribosome-binding protein
MSSPDEIRAQIEQTRSHLSDDVNSLSDTVSPSAVAKRQADKVRGAATSVREKVMGAASSTQSGAGSAASTVSDTVTGAPAAIADKAKGNPLAAGVIAFGAGLLLSSLLPASAQEQRAAAKVKDTAMPMITDAAKDVAADLKEPAQQAIESVKTTAADAAAEVKDQGASAASDLQSQAQDAKDHVQGAALTD